MSVFVVVRMGDDDDTPLFFQSPYGPESRTLDEERSGKKNVPFPPVNAEAREETARGHRTAIVSPSNGYRSHWEGENYAQEHENVKEERSNTYTGENGENIQESEEETNAQGNIDLLQPPTPAGRQEMVENNGNDNRGALEQEEKQREGKRCEVNESVQVVLSRSSEERGDGKTCPGVDNSKPNIRKTEG